MWIKEMKVAIIGSRNFNDYEFLRTACILFPDIDLIISGGARGADSLAERYAKEANIPTLIFKPDWSIGKQAGYLRNIKIIEAADIVLAFWDGVSKGTKHSIDLAEKYKRQLFIYSF
jgi:hypothetical protein